MELRATIEFHSCESDILAPVTKFGGQPVWIVEPQWPLSKEMGVQMRFICQIALEANMFPGCGGKVAYIFMTDAEDYVDGTWEPDGGENAVIIQPGGIISVPVITAKTGPILQNFVSFSGYDKLQLQDVVLAVKLSEGYDPDFISVEQASSLSEDQWKEYRAKIEGNKIGGTPGFLQGDEFPDEETTWKLLLQLDSCGVPFSVNFGDAGIAYAFINKDASIGKFLWQCC